MPLDRRLRDDLHRTAESIAPSTEVGLERVTRRAGSRSRTSSVLLTAAAAVVVIVFIAVILPGRRPDMSGPGGVDDTGSPGPTTRDVGILRPWFVTLTDTDPGVGSLGMAGDWRMSLDAGSAIDLTPPPGFVPPSGRAPDGYIHAENGSAFLTTLFARDFGASCTGSGTYTWSVTNGRLWLAAVDDTCDARRTLLTTRSWSATGPK